MALHDADSCTLKKNVAEANKKIRTGKIYLLTPGSKQTDNITSRNVEFFFIRYEFTLKNSN
jgi:hypothetical protein